jgi:hypothetical protein
MHLLRREQGVAITPIAFRPNRLGNRGHGLDPGPPTEPRPLPPTPLFRMGNSLLAVLGPQFDRFLQPCPTTSRPCDIPAGNIRQQQADSSPHVSLRKSLRGCGTGATDGPNQADNDSLICFIGRHLGAVLRRDRLRTRRHNCVSRMPN